LRINFEAKMAFCAGWNRGCRRRKSPSRPYAVSYIGLTHDNQGFFQFNNAYAGIFIVLPL
jgi:hypothetical protein